MPNLSNTLYPPYLETFQPAFVCTEPVKVFFSISKFNSDVNSQTKIHVSLVDATTNDNALRDAQGVIFKQLLFDDERKKYYVTIAPSDLINDESSQTKAAQFKTNQYYKVQLRFDNSDISLSTYENYSSAQKQSYLLNYQEYFSEWSSVTLIRPILKPTAVLRGFSLDDKEGTPGFNRGIIPIVGSVYWDYKETETGGTDYSTSETDTLEYYTLEILSSDGNNVLLSTDKIFTGDNVNPNELNYRFDSQDMGVTSDIDFILRFSGVTKNQYSWSQDFSFQIFEYTSDPNFDPVIEVDLDNENGYAKVHVFNDKIVYGTLYIKRSDNTSDFKNWEDIRVIKIGYDGKFAGELDYTFIDRTIGSLIWYRYSVQLETDEGTLTQLYRSDKFLADFFHMFIVRQDRQLGVKFNYSISSMKPVVSRTKFDTLGGKYPKFTENAVLNYKQFSISGMISAEADEEQLFLNKKEYFGSYKDSYDIYNNYYPPTHFNTEEEEALVERWRPIPESYDYFWEREFREEAIKWLNDGEPKLVKSMTEGNIAAILTDINLTPQASLSRRLWNFTATVYEIADATSLDVLSSLKIVDPYIDYEEDVGNTDPGIEPSTHKEKPGQIFMSTLNTQNDVISTIIEKELKYKYGGYLDNIDPRDVKIKNVKVTFNSKPHLFVRDKNKDQNLLVLTEQNWIDRLPTPEDRKRVVQGHTLSVNVGEGGQSANNSIIFVRKGYYQVPNIVNVNALHFPQGDLQITNSSGMTFSRADNVTIDYILDYDEVKLKGNTPVSTKIEKVIVAQLMGSFGFEEYLFQKIRKKHTFVKQGIYKIELQYWRGISVDCAPYAIMSIKYHDKDDYQQYIVGESGVFNMLEDSPIDNICFLGRQSFEQPFERQPYLKSYEFCFDNSGKEYSTYHDVNKPLENVVYSCNNEKWIYHRNMWFKFNESTNVIECPIEGTINYYANLYRSDY